MTTNERDTHFQGFTDLLFPEISKLFFTMYARISELRPIEEIDAVENEIKTLIALRAYNLASHVSVFTAGCYTSGYIDATKEVDIAIIPDLTEWPTHGSQGSPERQ